jgi:hypothetical protein
MCSSSLYQWRLASQVACGCRYASRKERLIELFRLHVIRTWQRSCRAIMALLQSERHDTWWYDMIYMIWYLTAFGLPPSGSSTVHIYTQTVHRTTQNKQYNTHLHTNSAQNDTKQTIHRTTQKFCKSAGRASSLRVLRWHLFYNWGKSTENLNQGI